MGIMVMISNESDERTCQHEKCYDATRLRSF